MGHISITTIMEKKLKQHIPEIVEICSKVRELVLSGFIHAHQEDKLPLAMLRKGGTGKKIPLKS